MSTHNICFSGEIRKIFTGYHPLTRPMTVYDKENMNTKMHYHRIYIENLSAINLHNSLDNKLMIFFFFFFFFFLHKIGFDVSCW